ncbi:MAG: amidase [Myxococcales bacterium]|nr:amidase [Myxococcales bacterium]
MDGRARLGELTAARCLEAIRAKNGELNAVLRVLDEPLHGRADGPLAGVPFVLKDVWDTPGVVTTGGSYRHRARVPESASHAFTALMNSGAVLLGKSNLCDLAFSPESDNHIRGPVRIPHDPSRTSGGSTGGGAAAVAAGLAAFDWGTDFGGSIRTPAGFCGIVGLRLSNATWPVEQHHFPRIAPFFWSFCGMGPLARTVDEARVVLDAVPELRKPSAPVVSMKLDEALVYGADAPLRGEWPTFEADAARLLDAAGVSHERATSLPPVSKVNDLFGAYLCAHFDDFTNDDELPVREGIAAVMLGLVSRGRLDKRVHPNTGILLAGVALGSRTLYRDVARWDDRLASLREEVRAIAARGHFVVTPTCTRLTPKHGRGAFTRGVQAFMRLGNMTDATAIAIPFGTFPGTKLPRSLHVLGPPGCERDLLAFAAKLEAAAAKLQPS